MNSQFRCKGSQLIKLGIKNPEKVKLFNQISKINLKPVKKIDITYDPFNLKSLSLREFAFQISTPKKKRTNIDLFVHQNIKSNLEEPEVTITFFNDYKLVFKTANLSLYDIALHYNNISESFIEEMG